VKIERAGPQDDAALKEFYTQSVLHGSVDVKVQRTGNFFDQYKLQSNDFHTYILKTPKEKIVGLATILFREGLLNEEMHAIGYCTDLRIAPSRTAILEWTDHFSPLLEQLSIEKKCDYFFSAIAQYQGRAYNALVRPRSVRRQIPRYYQLGRFEIVSVLGRLPIAPPRLKTITIRRAEANKDFEALARFLAKKTSGRLLSVKYTADLLNQRIQTWPGLSERSFLLALDQKQNIIGCVAPWDGSQVQKFLVEKYNGFGSTLRKGLNFISMTGLTSKLPREGGPLDFYYLTHFYADNPDIFYSLLFDAYEWARPKRFLVYSHFTVDPTTRPPRSFVTATVPFSLYTVLTHTTELPDFLRMPKVRRAPDFELACL
jgi:hypothetical protein